MLLSAAPLVLSLLATRVSAHWDWVKELPDCWIDCLKDTEDGCASSNCICDASQSNEYLPSAVACAATACDSDEFALQAAFVFPLESFCNLAGDEIPDSVISSAYEAASATSEPAPSTTRTADYSGRTTSASRTTERGGDEITDGVTSTMARTYTSGNGATVVELVPMVIGQDTTSFGETITSTVKAAVTVTQSLPSPTQEEGQTQGTSQTTSAPPAERTNSNGNGSPFENMQADAGRWAVSGLMVGLGAAAGVFMRL